MKLDMVLEHCGDFDTIRARAREGASARERVTESTTVLLEQLLKKGILEESNED